MTKLERQAAQHVDSLDQYFIGKQRQISIDSYIAGYRAAMSEAYYLHQHLIDDQNEKIEQFQSDLRVKSKYT